jgi:hypothetical protein
MKFNPNLASVNLMIFTASILLADVARMWVDVEEP